jgi:hypothetical protein
MVNYFLIVRGIFFLNFFAHTKSKPMRKFTTVLAIAFFAGVLVMNAQMTTVATGLTSPIGMCRSNGMLFVAEAGTGNDDSKIVMIDSMGSIHTVVFGLPSSFDTAAHEVSGAWRPFIKNNMLYVVVGGGPHPAAGSVLMYDMSSMNLGTDSVTIADTMNAILFSSWILSNGYSDSDPYSMTLEDDGEIYIADAGANAVFEADSAENIALTDSFPGIQNTFTPFPPVIDYVPTKIIDDGVGGYYVCNLTGFPFVPGIAQIAHIDSMDNVTTAYSGISVAVDMYMDSMTHDFYVLQYGVFDTMGNPQQGSASIIRIQPGGAMDTVASGFGPSAGMVSDSMGGFYVTEIMSGNVLHIANPSTGIQSPLNNIGLLKAFPNPFSESTGVYFSLNTASAVVYSLHDKTGRIIYSKDAGTLNEGNHFIKIEEKDLGKSLSSGSYFFTITTGSTSRTIPIIKN